MISNLQFFLSHFLLLPLFLTKELTPPPLSLKSDIADLTTKLNSRRKQKNKIN